jgi:hypothetical protein
MESIVEMSGETFENSSGTGTLIDNIGTVEPIERRGTLKTFRARWRGAGATEVIGRTNRSARFDAIAVGREIRISIITDGALKIQSERMKETAARRIRRIFTALNRGTKEGHSCEKWVWLKITPRG